MTLCRVVLAKTHNFIFSHQNNYTHLQYNFKNNIDMTNSQTFTSDEIKHALEYMMINELSQRADGSVVDKRYIDGFASRLFKNIEEDRAKDALRRAQHLPTQDILDAYNAGKRIQCRQKAYQNDKWSDLMTINECLEIHWHSDMFEYRVKPE